MATYGVFGIEDNPESEKTEVALSEEAGLEPGI